MQALTSGRVETLLELITEFDVDVAKPTDTGDSLLHIAISRGNSQIVKALLQHGAIVNAVTSYGESCLHQASSRGLLDVVKVLLEKGADVEAKMPRSEETSLHTAVRGGHTEVVENLLQHGAKINRVNKHKETTLHLAVECEAPMCLVDLLIDKGAKLDHLAKGRTPLHIAVSKNNSDAALSLMKAGSNVNLQDSNGFCAIHIASNLGNSDMVSSLLMQGANINGKGPLLDETRTWIGQRRHCPLHIAALAGQEEVVKVLLDGGADVDIATVDFDGYQEMPWCWIIHKETALHLAADAGNTNIVRHLLRKGADMSNIDVDGNMPHHLSLHSVHHQTLHTFLLRGCPINEKDADGKPALHQAIRVRDYDSVILLLMHGASVSPRRKQRRSIVHMLASDPNSTPNVFPALYYSGNTVSPVVHDPQHELIDLKISPTRGYIYDWLCEQPLLLQSLKIICRFHIRRHFRAINNRKSIWIYIKNLPLPPPLKRYLLLDEFNELELEQEFCPIISHKNRLTFSISPFEAGFNY